jgi:hypothetical protein
MVVKFNKACGEFQKGETAEIVSVSDCGVMARNRLSREKVLTHHHPEAFEAFRPRTIDVAVGDKILVRENIPKAELINGEVLTVAGFCKDGRISTKEGKDIPANCRSLTHGYALTSYRAQGRTADHVIVAAASLDSKACYVASSRGRESCTIHTPSTQQLMDHLPPSKTGDRKAALESLAQSAPSHAKTPRLRHPLDKVVATAELVVGNRALVWGSLLPQSASRLLAHSMRWAMPGLGQLQGLVSLARTAHNWSFQITAEMEIERNKL